MTYPGWLDEVTTDAGALLGLPGRLVSPAPLVQVFAAVVETLLLDGPGIPEGRYAPRKGYRCLPKSGAIAGMPRHGCYGVASPVSDINK